jgi:hypothetical protein
MKTIVNSICAKALVAVALTGAALSASADYLYWTVTDPKGDANSGKQGEDIPFYYATVKADGTQLNIYDAENGAVTPYWKLYADETGRSVDIPAWSGSFDSNVSTFLVELWSSDGTRTGWQSYSASSVASYIWSGDNANALNLNNPLVVNSVVPEPTSGMLLVLGGALLALRRRRRVMA